MVVEVVADTQLPMVLLVVRVVAVVRAPAALAAREIHHQHHRHKEIMVVMVHQRLVVQDLVEEAAVAQVLLVEMRHQLQVAMVVMDLHQRSLEHL
jgi:hypothetical protein